MSQHKNAFIDYMAAQRFIAFNVCIYGMSKEKLSECDGNGYDYSGRNN
jgi:hypothetical protein